MIYRTRKLIKPADLNGHDTLFGGRLMAWIDEECAVYATCQMKTPGNVTKFISEMNFIAPAFQGDIIEIGVETIATGRTSLTLRCEVRNIRSKQVIITIEKLVFVAVDKDGRPMEYRKAASETASDEQDDWTSA